MWETKPQLHYLPKEYFKEPAVIVSQSDKIEYKYEGRSTSVYRTYYRLYKINDERGIAMYSTCTLPFHSSTDIQEIKARTITPSGKVVNIPDHMFKLSHNEYGEPVVKFAMEGVVKNAEIEIYMKTLSSFNMFGVEYLQADVPIMDMDFEMSYPKNFIIEQHGFNGFDNATDTLISGRRHLKINMKDVPGIKQEAFSNVLPHLMRTEWRISYWANDNGDEGRLFTWDEFAHDFYHNVFNLPDGVMPDQYFLNPHGRDLYKNDVERNAVNNFLQSIGVTGSERELDKIIKIERGIKNNIILSPITNDHSGRLDSIISKRAATSFGYVKLFAACFAQADVTCEIGSTTDKRYHLFNSSFENWDYLSDYVFYFPNQKHYMAPTDVMLRYPMLPSEVLANTAVFCKMSTPAEARPKVADIRLIPETKAADNRTKLQAKISFINMQPTMDLRYEYSGQAAIPARTRFAIGTGKDYRQDLMERTLNGISKPTDLVKFDVRNVSLDSYITAKPVEVIAKVKPSNMVDKAGGKYLVKIGELLGSHVEMYSKADRKLPVDLAYTAEEDLEITVNIPAGYRVLNADALKMEFEFFDKDNPKIPSAGFRSTYSLHGNKLTIRVREIYSHSHYHLSEYEQFRKVVNTASDFNKVVLALGR